ncbi:hypothetical protein [Conservatibacter flavescens]|uniref:hypothetical protein n=1 Tax=Conservatibacter flavescens TaxID=28161 RepID=UPI001056811E|nr:hypothetical protein [Conservatibacter flavescens]
MMAAQKLTKTRLIQIIVMLIILLTAFFYKTYQHYGESSVEKQRESAVQNENILEKEANH